MANTEIARLAGASRPTVLKWRRRYLAHGLSGLDDDPRPGRPVAIDELAVLSETLADGGKPPAHLGVTHWLVADRLGISFASVARIWRKYDIQPQRVAAFDASTGPKLEAKIGDVVAAASVSGTASASRPVKPSAAAVRPRSATSNTR